MKIGAAAVRSNLPERTLRYYESIGLVVPPRMKNGYRDYRDEDVSRLRLVGSARGLGFSIEDCRTLLTLYEDKGRASADVRALAKAHLDEVERKIIDLQSMRGALTGLVSACAGDASPNCPILEGLTSGDVISEQAADPETRACSHG